MFTCMPTDQTAGPVNPTEWRDFTSDHVRYSHACGALMLRMLPVVLAGCWPYIQDPRLDPEGEDWSGSLAAFAHFDQEDWRQEPYCSGPIGGSIASDGEVWLHGYCTFAWGPFEGAQLAVAAEGELAADDSVDLLVAFGSEGSGRDFEDAQLTGVLDDGLIARGPSSYTSEALGSPVAAEVEVRVFEH